MNDGDKLIWKKDNTSVEMQYQEGYWISPDGIVYDEPYLVKNGWAKGTENEKQSSNNSGHNKG